MATNPDKAKAEDQGPRIIWDDSHMKSSYANVCNVSSTREEVVLMFGVNQSWLGGGQKEVTVQLTERIILSPFAAKRLAEVLGNVLKEQEARFGALTPEMRTPPKEASKEPAKDDFLKGKN